MDDEWNGNSLVNGRQAIKIDDGLAVQEKMHVPDRDGETVNAGGVDKTSRFVRIGEACAGRRCRAGIRIQLALDGQPGSVAAGRCRSADCLRASSACQ